MKKIDNSKPSLVEFLGSIKFSQEQDSSTLAGKCSGHFARLQPMTRRQQRSEDTQLIRSAN